MRTYKNSKGEKIEKGKIYKLVESDNGYMREIYVLIQGTFPHKPFNLRAKNIKTGVVVGLDKVRAKRLVPLSLEDRIL